MVERRSAPLNTEYLESTFLPVANRIDKFDAQAMSTNKSAPIELSEWLFAFYLRLIVCLSSRPEYEYNFFLFSRFDLLNGNSAK